MQLQLAERNGIRIDDTMLNNKLRELASENNMTLGEFRDILERDGFSYNEFRDDLRREMTIKQLRQQMVGSRLKVSDQEIDNLLASLRTLDEDNVQDPGEPVLADVTVTVTASLFDPVIDIDHWVPGDSIDFVGPTVNEVHATATSCDVRIEDSGPGIELTGETSTEVTIFAAP